jgi:uncharacterized protein with PIN domain
MATETIICCKCNQPLELVECNLEYLGQKVKHPLLTCTVCKAVFIPEELVEGRIHEVETLFEDK